MSTFDAGRSLIPYCWVSGVALIEVFANVSLGPYIWTAPAWLLRYLSASRFRLTEEVERSAVPTSASDNDRNIERSICQLNPFASVHFVALMVFAIN